jgi:hypothetical protein
VVVVGRAAEEQPRPVITGRGALDRAVRVAGENRVRALGQVPISIRPVAVGVVLGVCQPILRMVQHRDRERSRVVIARIHQRHRLKLRQAEPKLS